MWLWTLRVLPIVIAYTVMAEIVKAYIGMAHTTYNYSRSETASKDPYIGLIYTAMVYMVMANIGVAHVACACRVLHLHFCLRR